MKPSPSIAAPLVYGLMRHKPVTHKPPAVAEAVRDSFAAPALLLGTIGWGFSFTWAKAAGEGINHAVALPPGSLLGPLLLLSWRFSAAGLLWMLLFPDARRGWTLKSAKRSVMLGLLLWAGQTVQMLGLDRTSEAVSAFLTSLTVVFVPLLLTVGIRRPPPPSIWLPVGLAALGIWLMTGAAPTGFGLGEMLGLTCAIVFSGHMIALGEVVRRDSSSRMAVGQFLVVGIASTVSCFFVGQGPTTLTSRVHWDVLTTQAIWVNVVPLTLFATMGSFGLMFYFQPRIDPTRAALIYLAEPIFAALYAYVAVGRVLSPIAILGAGLILGANVLVELLERHERPRMVAIAMRKSTAQGAGVQSTGLGLEP